MPVLQARRNQDRGKNAIPGNPRSQTETVIIAADSSREGIGSCRETPHREISRRAGACCTHMKASFGALLAWMVILAGCVGPGAFESPKVLEYLDGNYRTLASCTHQQLARQYGQLRMTDLRERRTVTIGPPQGQWEFSFIDDDGGRQTRLEVTSANGALPGEHALALARACAA